MNEKTLCGFSVSHFYFSKFNSYDTSKTRFKLFQVILLKFIKLPFLDGFSNSCELKFLHALDTTRYINWS